MTDFGYMSKETLGKLMDASWWMGFFCGAFCVICLVGFFMACCR